MNSIGLLKIIIEKLEQYEQYADDKENLSLNAFFKFVSPQADLESLKNTFVAQKSFPVGDRASFIENNIERVIAQHILFLYRYIKFYAKLAFTETTIKSIEEFSMLITVMQFQSISKTDLIKRNVIEKSSGIEIINRLIKNGMLSQQDNPNDQRSQLISLTDTGKFELFKTFEKMNTLGKISTGELTYPEKEQLAVMLKKLDHFHFENYTHKERNTLDDYLPELK